MEEGTTSRRDSSSRVDSSLPPPLNRTRFKSLCLTRSQENNFKLQRAFLSSSRVELPPQLPEITKDWRIQNSGEYPWALNSTRDRPSTSQSSKSKRRWSAFIINSDREASTNGLSRVETMEFGSTNHTSEEVPSPPYFQNETHPQTATNFYPFPADRSDRGQNLRQGSGRNNQTGLNKVRRLSWVHFSSPHNSVRNPPRLESKKKRKKRKSISGTLISMIFNVFKHRSQSNQVKKPGKHPVLTSVSSDRDSLNRIGQESNRIHIHENRNLSMAYNRIEHEHRTTQMSNHEMLNPVSLQSMELTTSVAWQNNVTAIQSRALKESMTQGFPVTISNKEDQFFIQNQFGSYVRQKQIRNSLSFTRESRSHLSPKPIRTTVESRIKLTEQSPQHYARKCTLNVRNASGQINQAIRNKRVGKLEGEFENSELIRAEPQPAIISTISLPRAKVEISNLDNIGSYIQSEECKLSPMKREWVQHQPTVSISPSYHSQPSIAQPQGYPLRMVKDY